MSELGDLPALPVVPIVAATAQPTLDEAKLANSITVPSQANSITALTGLSGAGKSELANTGAEYAYERFGKTTLCYAIDPGGFGNNRLALIRAGIMRVWDPRNHVNFFETMELATLGGWPEKILDPETGYADPNVRIILPRRVVYALICPSGHVAKTFENEAVLNASQVPCAECGVITHLQNAQRVDRTIVRNRMFRDVGLRIYDSISAASDAGLLIEIPNDSATNRLPTTNSGGRLLGSADALKSGTMTFGSGSEAQVGFMQNRAYGWLMNIRKIPDQVVPAICTFGLEESKQDDESGGVKVLGMRLAGKARTSASAGWVGNLLYAAHEPKSMEAVDANKMVYRLWMTNHYDPRDVRKLTILAKHRGGPIDMPDFLEDPWDPDPKVRAAKAWTQCSLKVFYTLQEAQLAKIEAAKREQYPDAPGYQGVVVEDGDDVIGTLGSRMTQGGGAQPAASLPSAVTVPGTAIASSAAPMAAGGRVRRRGAVAPPPNMPIMPPVQAAPIAPAAQAPPIPPPVPTPALVATEPTASPVLGAAQAPAASAAAKPVGVPASSRPDVGGTAGVVVEPAAAVAAPAVAAPVAPVPPPPPPVVQPAPPVVPAVPITAPAGASTPVASAAPTPTTPTTTPTPAPVAAPSPHRVRRVPRPPVSS